MALGQHTLLAVFPLRNARSQRPWCQSLPEALVSALKVGQAERVGGEIMVKGSATGVARGGADNPRRFPRVR